MSATKTEHQRMREADPVKLWASYTARNLRVRAEKNGLEYLMNPAMLRAIWTDECPVFKVPFEFGHHHYRPSIDRIVPSRGYVPGNIRLISMLANQVKSDATTAQVYQVFKWMEKQHELID